MKHSKTIAMWTLLTTAVLAGAAPGAAAETTTAAGAATLDWMAGSWSSTNDGVVSEEHWTSAHGGALVGMHKDVKGGRMTSFEFLRIVVDGGGRLCYLASPGGAPPTTFCAIEVANRKVVFENRAHDFPQRILYWLDAEDRLHARIEGPMQGEEIAEEWVFRRVPR